MQAKHIRARRRREELKLTQRQVAKSCRVTQQAYEKFERGETKRPRYFYELARALRVSPEWLLTGEGIAAEDPKSLEAAPDTGRKIPVYSFGSVLKSGNRKYTFNESEIIDRIAPLPGLEETAGVMALFIQSDDLGPAFPQGTILYVDRNKQPALKKPCLCLHYQGMEILVYLGAKGSVHYFSAVDSKKKKAIKAKDINGIYRISGMIYS